VSRDSRLYLADMRDACERIAKHRANSDRLEVLSDPKTRDAILWNLLILGEAAKQVPGEITERHPAVEWRRIAGFRDVLAHGYFGLDDDILWDVISNKVPQVQKAVEIALGSTE
jgi:uncharacterized protein with HEPN domain